MDELVSDVPPLRIVVGRFVYPRRIDDSGIRSELHPCAIKWVIKYTYTVIMDAACVTP